MENIERIVSGPLGYTPLASSIRNQVLKYNFRGISRIVADKSAHGNNGKLMPKEDPPKRKIISLFPLEMAVDFDGEDDFIKVPSSPSLKLSEPMTIEVTIQSDETRWKRGNTMIAECQTGPGEKGWRLDGQINRSNYRFMVYGPEGGRIKAPVDIAEKNKVRFIVEEDGDMVMYLNDNKVENPEVRGEPVSFSPVETDLLIGRAEFWRRTHFKGRIHEIRVWNQAVHPG